jgi:hypothetical protein
MKGIDVVINANRQFYYIGGTDQGQMLAAAQCYVTAAKNIMAGKTELVFKGKEVIVPRNWPDDAGSFAPSGIAKNNLKTAATLIIAEWDRLDRLGL